MTITLNRPLLWNERESFELAVRSFEKNTPFQSEVFKISGNRRMMRLIKNRKTVVKLRKKRQPRR